MTLKVGIISAAWGAFAHLPAWRAVPGIEVVGICTSRRETAEKAAAQHGIPRAFWDAEAMAADPGIDIVDCGTRPAIREAMVLAALASGKHVYNGIPFAKDLDGARRLHHAWRAAGTVGVVDAYAQWLPAHALARERIVDGTLGQPFGGTFHMNLGLFNRPHPAFPYNWFAEAGHGVSAVRNLGSHGLHLLHYLFGDIVEVVADDRRVLPEWTFPDGSAIKVETNDLATALLRFGSGLILQFQVSWSAALQPGWRLDAFGSNGRILLQAPTFPTALDTTLDAGTLDGGALSRVEIPTRLLAAPEVTIDAHATVPAAYGMALSMQRMADAIRGDAAAAAPDFEQAWQVERVQEAIRRSSADGRWVKLAEID